MYARTHDFQLYIHSWTKSSEASPKDVYTPDLSTRITYAEYMKYMTLRVKRTHTYTHTHADQYLSPFFPLLLHIL